MQINMSETMRECLQKCVEFAISRTLGLVAIDYERDEEITMDEALEFLKGVRE